MSPVIFSFKLVTLSLLRHVPSTSFSAAVGSNKLIAFIFPKFSITNITVSHIQKILSSTGSFDVISHSFSSNFDDCQLLVCS